MMKKHTESLGELRGLRRLLLLYCPALMYHASATSIGQRLVGINGCRHRSLVHHFAEKGLRMCNTSIESARMCVCVYMRMCLCVYGSWQVKILQSRYSQNVPAILSQVQAGSG